MISLLYMEKYLTYRTFSHTIRPMSATRETRIAANEPVRLHTHAMDNLRFIRETMERSTSFTAVPGWGTAGMGVIACAGALTASFMASETAWLTVWIVAAFWAVALGTATLVRKARLVNESLFQGAGRRFVLGMLPPVAAGMVLTAVFFQLNLFSIMPATWLLLYGAGVVTGGAYSVRIVPVMGLCFMILGIVTFGISTAWANAVMALGFGGFHMLFGIIIARRHGG